MLLKRIIIAVAIVAISMLLTVHLLVSRSHIYDRDIAKQKIIARAYVKYYGDKKVLAQSLQQLVDAGYLPARGSFYNEPPGFFMRESDAAHGSYSLFPNTLETIARGKVLGRKSDVVDWEFDPRINAQIRDGISEQIEPHKPTGAR